jgi:DNA repair protein RAD50
VPFRFFVYFCDQITKHTGKTTIIECLKYATTSDMPPNTKGVSFLFDPKLIDQIETRGRIKLFFKDTSGLGVQVQKNMCTTQKAKKLEFRTLETIISRYDKNLKLASTVTSKCINTDAEVINALGVSKPVLEYVIFCHQEESNWFFGKKESICESIYIYLSTLLFAFTILLTSRRQAAQDSIR